MNDTSTKILVEGVDNKVTSSLVALMSFALFVVIGGMSLLENMFRGDSPAPVLTIIVTIISIPAFLVYIDTEEKKQKEAVKKSGENVAEFLEDKYGLRVNPESCIDDTNVTANSIEAITRTGEAIRITIKLEESGAAVTPYKAVPYAESKDEEELKGSLVADL